ncbi:MAG TPA: hypothetical protein VJB65_04010 [Patescibacteria group bacterium]|nr:hypothetical protein [Patescibacteria group bacterium]
MPHFYTAHQRLTRTIVCILTGIMILGLLIVGMIYYLLVREPLQIPSPTPISLPTEFSGTIAWHDENTGPTSLCGGTIQATISFSLHTLPEKPDALQGNGTITYDNIQYSTQRQCTDCVIDGKKSAFTLTGSIVDTTRTARIQPTLAKTGIVETEQSVLCFPHDLQNTVASQNLYFSLFQGGFFDEWEVILPELISKITTKKFFWNIPNHRGWGTLTLTAIR